jgi:hypothetical protein
VHHDLLLVRLRPVAAAAVLRGSPGLPLPASASAPSPWTVAAPPCAFPTHWRVEEEEQAPVLVYLSQQQPIVTDELGQLTVGEQSHQPSRMKTWRAAAVAAASVIWTACQR